MSDIYIYECEQDKYYVGKSKDRCEWTKLYKPIRLVETCIGDDFDADKYTLKYMAKYGVDNVRGGSFSNVEFSFTDKEMLIRMIREVTGEYEDTDSEDNRNKIKLILNSLTFVAPNGCEHKKKLFWYYMLPIALKSNTQHYVTIGELNQQIIKAYVLFDPVTISDNKFYKISNVTVLSELDIKKLYPYIDKFLITYDLYNLDNYDNPTYILPYKLGHGTHPCKGFTDMKFAKNLKWVDMIKLKRYQEYLEFKDI